MSATISLYPHRVADRICLRLSGFEDPHSTEVVTVKGPPPSTSESDGDRPSPVYSLTAGLQTWRRLNFDVEAQVTPEQLAWALPPGLEPSEATKMVVVLTCPSTKVRHGIQMPYQGRGVWRGEAFLSRDDVAHRVFLSPQLFLAKELDEAPAGYASTKATLIGVGERGRYR